MGSEHRPTRPSDTTRRQFSVNNIATILAIMQYLNSYKTSCCARQHDFRRAPWCAPACPHTGCTHSTIPHKNRARRAVRSQATLADVTAQLQPTNQDATPAQQAAAQQLPRTFRRLVARECGRSFREVAQVVEVELVPPGPGEVGQMLTGCAVRTPSTNTRHRHSPSSHACQHPSSLRLCGRDG